MLVDRPPLSNRGLVAAPTRLGSSPSLSYSYRAVINDLDGLHVLCNECVLGRLMCCWACGVLRCPSASARQSPYLTDPGQTVELAAWLA